MHIKTINKVRVSDRFWKDLGKWRNHPDYWSIRSSIGDMVLLGAKGEPMGDEPFSGKKWDNIRHKHIEAKLIFFSSYAEAGTMVFCGLDKHDAYGFKRERKKLADNHAAKMQRAAEADHVASPGWSSIRWKHPKDIVNHPELPELSQDGLKKLFDTLSEEADTLNIFQRLSKNMSLKEEALFFDDWASSLCDATDAIERHLYINARNTNHMKPREFDRWQAAPDFS